MRLDSKHILFEKMRGSRRNCENVFGLTVAGEVTSEADRVGTGYAQTAQVHILALVASY